MGVSRAKSIRRTVAIITAAVAVWFVAAFVAFRPARPDTPLRIGYSEVPPGGAERPSNLMSGFAAEVVDAAARRRGMRVEWVLARGTPEEALTSGLADLWPRLSRDPDSRSELYFTEPWLSMAFCLVSRANTVRDPAAPGMRIAHNANPYIRGMMRRHLPGAVPVPVRGPAALLGAVCEGKSDASLLEARVAQALLLSRVANCAGTSLRVTPVEGAVSLSGIAARPGFEDGADELREEIGAMASDGSLDRIHADWFLITTAETQALHDVQRARRDNWRLSGLALASLMAAWWMVRLTRRLRTAHQAASEANAAATRLLGAFLAEIRRPAKVLPEAARALLDGPLPEDRLAAARAVARGASDLTRIVESFEDLTAADAAESTLDSAAYDPRRVTVGALDRWRAESERNGGAIWFDDSAAPAAAEGDAGRVGRALFHLAGGAVTAKTEGAVRVTLLLREEPGLGARMRWEIRGPGSRGSGDGADLGMAVAKRLAALMGGEAGIEIHPADGVMRWLELPYVQAAAPPLRVLVHDGDTVRRAETELLFGRLGHAVESACDAKQALAIWERGTCDLLLIDGAMPLLNGDPALAALRKREAREATGGGMPPSAGTPLEIGALAEALLASRVTLRTGAGQFFALGTTKSGGS